MMRTESCPRETFNEDTKSCSDKIIPFFSSLAIPTVRIMLTFAYEAESHLRGCSPNKAQMTPSVENKDGHEERWRTSSMLQG
jgi:hypothetical protein